MNEIDETVCIGCGCSEFNACLDTCWWLVVDYEKKIGVCSNCTDQLEEFHKQLNDIK